LAFLTGELKLLRGRLRVPVGLDEVVEDGGRVASSSSSSSSRIATLTPPMKDSFEDSVNRDDDEDSAAVSCSRASSLVCQFQIKG
jgi:hypothetical protein